mgnify:CR=1 FL=1
MDNTIVVISEFKKNFKSLNGKHLINITILDIARGYISIGKSHWNKRIKNIKTNGCWSEFYGNLEEYPKLRITSEFEKLDSTDKGIISYKLGMGISKIIAEKYLNIPYIQNVDALINEGIINLTKGTNERGDLVGIDINKNWHVIEAKGRTSKLTSSIKIKAKTQVEKISKIDKKKPKTKSYCITHINKNRSEIFLNDPDGSTTNVVELEINDKMFIKNYYDRIFSNYYHTNSNIEVFFVNYDLIFKLFFTGSDNLYIGIENRLFQDLNQDNLDFLQDLPLLISNYKNLINLSNEVISFGSDGTLLFRDLNNDILYNFITNINNDISIRNLDNYGTNENEQVLEVEIT